MEKLAAARPDPRLDQWRADLRSWCESEGIYLSDDAAWLDPQWWAKNRMTEVEVREWADRLGLDPKTLVPLDDQEQPPR